MEVRNVEKRLRLEMSQLEQKNELLRRDQEKQEVLLERAKSGLDAAHQLNAQIEEKTRAILHLKTQGKKKLSPGSLHEIKMFVFEPLHSLFLKLQVILSRFSMC